MNTATKIPITQIILNQIEGKTADARGPLTFPTFTAANAFLKQACQACDQKDPGGNKADFKLCFADGESYEGTFCIAHPHSSSHEYPNLGDRVRMTLTYCAGLAARPGQSDEEYAESLERLRKRDPALIDRSLHFLKTYSLDDPPAVAVAVDDGRKVATIGQSAAEVLNCLHEKQCQIALRIGIEKVSQAIESAEKHVEHLKKNSLPYAEAQARAMSIRKALIPLNSAIIKPHEGTKP